MVYGVNYLRLLTVLLPIYYADGALNLSLISIPNLLSFQQIQSPDTKSQVTLLLQTGKSEAHQGQLRQALSTFKQAQALLTNAPSEDLAETFYSLGETYKYLGEYKQAIEALQQSLAIYQTLGNATGSGKVKTQLGEAYSILGDSQQALNLLQQALADYSKQQPRLNATTIQFERGKTLRIQGEIYTGLGQYDRAWSILQEALTIQRSLQNQIEEGRVLNSLGGIYRHQGQYEQALQLQQQALTLIRATGDRVREGPTLDAIGIIYYSLGEYKQALEFYQQGWKIRRDIGAKGGEANSLNNMALIYESLGDYPQAIETYQQALRITRSIGLRELEGNVLSNMGGVYYRLGQFPQSLKFYEQALEIIRSVQALNGEADILQNMGGVYEQSGQFKQALALYEQALKIYRQIGDQAGEAFVLHIVGGVYSTKADYPQALRYLRQALTLRQKLGDQAGEGATLNNMGQIYHAQENYSKALLYYQQALKVLQKIGDRQGAGITLTNMGTALLNDNRFAEAEAALFESAAVLESLRQGLSDADKVAIFETQTNNYIALQKALVAQNKVGTALEVAERGRARAFVELLARRIRSPLSTQTGDSDIEQTDIQPVESLNIQQIAQVARDQNATLIEYSIIWNEQLLIWVIQPSGKTTLRQVRLQPQMPLAELVITARCFDNITCQNNTSLRGSSPLSFNLAAQNRQFETSQAEPAPNNLGLKQLHQLLIDPIADLLPTNPNQKVIFIPQGELFLVPFAALQDEQNQYLIDRHTILTAPSIQILQFTRQQRQQLKLLSRSENYANNILIVGNPTMPTVKSSKDDLERQLTNLPGAEQEARSIGVLLNVPMLTGNQATKANILQRMPQARLIHLATHGLLDDFGSDIPGAIALAPSRSDNGFLTTREILNLKLIAELVVLSACDTGQGKITGDGVIGLSRSLITAGVPSVIVSLWAIPDMPTAQLMTQFYQNLQQGQDKATALRQAMLTTKQNFPDPKSWAAFTLIGEAE